MLVLSLPLTRATRGMIGARELGRMKRDAILVNLARGEILDEAALYAHLLAEPGFTACLDAWWVEPVRHGAFRMGHPLTGCPTSSARRTIPASIRGVREVALAGRRRIAGGCWTGCRRCTWPAPTSGPHGLPSGGSIARSGR